MSQVPEIIQIKCSLFRYVEYTPKMVIKLAYTLYLCAYIWSENAKPIRLAVAVLPIALYTQYCPYLLEKRTWKKVVLHQYLLACCQYDQRNQ